MRISTSVTSLVIVALMSSLAMSQVYFAKESFDYPIGASIDTLMGEASNGWAGSWYKIVTSQANAAVVADTGLPYGDLDYEVSHVGNHLESVPDPTGTELRWGRNLDKTWPDEAGQEYWISFLMDVKNATDNATWIGVKFYNGASGELGMLGKGHGLDKYTVGSGWHGSEPQPEVSQVSWDTGPVWLVGKVVMSGGVGPDPIYMWINPDPTAVAPDTALKDAVAYGAQMDNGFDVIRIEFGGTIGDGLQVSIDELRLGTSWGDVSSFMPTTAITWRHNELPNQFALSQNYPNPFNPNTTIHYTLKGNGKVHLAVYDLMGREVAVLVEGVQNAGEHIVNFNAAGWSSGIYFYRLQTANEVVTKKMTLLK